MSTREDLSYGELIARDTMGVGDGAFTPDGELHVIVAVVLSDGDDGENPAADRVTLGNGVEYFRDDLEAADLDALIRDGNDERRDREAAR